MGGVYSLAHLGKVSREDFNLTSLSVSNIVPASGPRRSAWKSSSRLDCLAISLRLFDPAQPLSCTSYALGHGPAVHLGLNRI